MFDKILILKIHVEDEKKNIYLYKIRDRENEEKEFFFSRRSLASCLAHWLDW